MSGFAAAIDWRDPVNADVVESMLGLVPHRANNGSDRLAFTHAALGEARSEGSPNPSSVSHVGRFSIVGDLRLWARQGLRARAGGSAAAEGLDDRQLILAAYARTGIGFLDDLDGDFAFVIWDDERHRLLAVRDRFGAKPLFFSQTPTGLRLASEPKQLLAVSTAPVEPSDQKIFEFLAEQHRSSRLTFFDGVERVRAAEYVVFGDGTVSRSTYWSPTSGAKHETSPGSVSSAFRSHLVDSVRSRLSTSGGVVTQLTGGLDSSSVAAAAGIVSSHDNETSPIQTVSAVFPGYAADESHWIDEIAASQPFKHHDYVPTPGSMDSFAAAMWQTDGPLVNRVRGLLSGTAEIAGAVGADLVLMGSGGDEVLDQEHLLVDLLRSRSFGCWLGGVRSEAAWRGTPVALPVEKSIRLALPPRLRRSLRRVLGIPAGQRPTLMNAAFVSSIAPVELEEVADLQLAPSHTLQLVLGSTRDARRILLNEAQHAEYAYGGVDVSYPYLDRHLVEFIASVHPNDRPFDGRTKTLVRQGFVGLLPPSVLDRRTETIVDDYLDAQFLRLARTFRQRYPSVSEPALRYLDTARYADALSQLESGGTDRYVRESLWYAWMLMLWLDGFGAYAPEHTSHMTHERDRCVSAEESAADRRSG